MAVPMPPEEDIRRKILSIRNMVQYKNYNDVEIRRKAIELLQKKELRKETDGQVGHPRTRLPKPQGKFLETIGTPHIDPDLCVMVGLHPVVIRNDTQKQIIEKEFDNIKNRVEDWESHSVIISQYLSVLVEMEECRGTSRISGADYKNLMDYMMNLKKELGLDRRSVLLEGEESGREIIQEAMRKAAVQIERHRDAFKWMCPRCGKVNIMESPHFLFSSWCGNNETPEECAKCQLREKCGKTLWNERIFRAVRDREMSIFLAADIFETSVYNILYLAQLHDFKMGESFNFRFNDIDQMRECLKREAKEWGIEKHPSLVGIE